MAKAQSPVRLQRDLMDSATVAGSLFHRSAAEQVEYWATIGRTLQNLVGVDTILDIMAGTVKIKLEDAPQVIVDPDDVFTDIEEKRHTGALSAPLLPGEFRYQASKSQPGLLEQVSEAGTVVGQFEEGEFKSQ